MMVKQLEVSFNSRNKMNIKVEKSHKQFDGETLFYSHNSDTTNTEMKFSCFIPNEERKAKNAIVWLSGLTCTEENFITKAGAQRFLSGTNTMIICPDTSPRGLNLKDEHESYDFGSGAGFYVNATTEEYKNHYNMYDYVLKDILNILKENFEVQNLSIMGHSMGGHGALVIGLRNANIFKAISAFSPIVNPVNCPWGKKAFEGYLGVDQSSWKQYDSCELINTDNIFPGEILIDQGTSDEFLEEQLLTENLERICREKGQELRVNMRDGFDHSFYFISTFIEDHISKHLSSFQ